MKKPKTGKTVSETLKGGFRNEKEFINFLSDNRTYVLSLMSGDMTWGRHRYICDSTLLVCAVRYALGRKTGIVQHVVDWILGEWESMENEVKADIVNEILQHERHYGSLGASWDREQWYRVVNRNICGLLDETV